MEKVFLEGYEAYIDNIPFSGNPYVIILNRRYKANLWGLGWMRASEIYAKFGLFGVKIYLWVRLL